MFRILFALYLPLMLAPVPVGAVQSTKKPGRKAASESVKTETSPRKLADNYDTDLSYTLEIQVKNVSPKKKSR